MKPLAQTTVSKGLPATVMNYLEMVFNTSGTNVNNVSSVLPSAKDHALNWDWKNKRFW
jgi:hypothetical protein